MNVSSYIWLSHNSALPKVTIKRNRETRQRERDKGERVHVLSKFFRNWNAHTHTHTHTHPLLAKSECWEKMTRMRREGQGKNVWERDCKWGNAGASCHMYGWVMSHTWMSHVTHMNESCHTYGWVTSHIWMSHVIHIDESWHTSWVWVMAHILRCVPWLNMSCLINMCDMTHSYVWRQHDSRCVPWLNISCCILLSHVTRGWVMSHIWMSSVAHMNGSCHTYEWVMSHIWMSHVTHQNESCHAQE